MISSHLLGRQGEAFALGFLEDQGYSLIEQNYQTRLGEIDIIAKQGETICFVEVKARQEDGYDPLESIDWRKQRQLVRLAQAYLIETYETEDVDARFDVVAVYQQEDGKLKAELIQNAFDT